MGDTSRIYQALTRRPWAITEDYLRLMVEIAARKPVDLGAVEERLGRKLENTRAVTERGGVAIVPITGPIFRYANLFSEISGGTSVQVLARDFTAALNAPDVRAILLQVDSPGGDANGINEFAEMIHAARGKKPITAYIGGMGCSAAYWIASAADSIVCDATALVGSIGVIASMPAGDDPSEVTFISSQSPRKRANPATEEGRADIQATIDAMADVFVETVARNRGVTADRVLSDFGQGGIFVGQGAVDAGLADRLGSFEATLAEMSGGRSAPVTQAQAQHIPTSIPAYTPAQIAALGIPFTATATTAAGGLRANIRPITQPKEVARMSDNPHLEEAPPATSELTAAEQAHIERLVAERESAWQDRERLLLAEAEARFERRIAEERARTAIQQYAQHATTPTLQRQHALPLEPDTLGKFLSSLAPAQRTEAQTLFTRILDAGLVSFEEIGSAGDPGDEPTAKERFDAAVLAKIGAGMSKLAAMQAVGKEQPALYAEYQAESLTPKVAPKPAAAKKGGR